MAGRTKTIEIVGTEWVTSGFFGFSVEREVRTPIVVPNYSPNDEDQRWVDTQIGDAPYDNPNHPDLYQCDLGASVLGAIDGEWDGIPTALRPKPMLPLKFREWK